MAHPGCLCSGLSERSQKVGCIFRDSWSVAYHAIPNHSLASSLTSSKKKKTLKLPADNRKSRVVRRDHAPLDVSSQSSLDSQPHTAHPVLIDEVSIYSQESTDLAYLREASIKSVRRYLKDVPKVVETKRDKMARARLFLLGTSKEGKAV